MTARAAEGLDDRPCVVVDSDAGLDDFRAVAALVPNRPVVAIVVTEGLARARQGAGAMERFLALAGLPPIPVIPGPRPNPDRQRIVDRHLETDWRPTAETLNGLLPAPVSSSVPESADVPALLRSHTKGCTRITLLVIGPWTSFMQYAAELLGRVDKIVAQGRPYPDEIGGEPTGFNCTYDIDSCLAAFDLLVGRRQRADRKLHAEWVDIPTGITACRTAEPGVDAHGNIVRAFAPDRNWIFDLQHAGRSARTVGEMLDCNAAGWAMTSLWDDLAALYLLRPEIFAPRGGHMEPCIAAVAVRALLIDQMNRQR